MGIKNESLKQATENPSTVIPDPDVSKQLLEGKIITPVSTGTEDDYIKTWLRSLTILHRGHWDAARHYEKVNLSLGIAVAISAAISGTTAFSQLQQQADQGGLHIGLQVVVGIFAFAAAALGGVQAFVRPSEISGRHKQAGQKYGKLRRELELHLNLGLPQVLKDREVLLTDFRTRMDSVDEESLPLPKRIYDKVETEFEKKASRI
jgi:hypothetical protein